MKISRIEIENFKSIKKLDLPLNNINILIGANGAGKSNFIQFFNLLSDIEIGYLQNYTAKNGGADRILYFGRKQSDVLKGILSLDIYSYKFTLSPTNENTFYFLEEEVHYLDAVRNVVESINFQSGHKESKWTSLLKSNVEPAELTFMMGFINKLKVYHFNDTSSSARVKQEVNINDNRRLHYHANNLAAFLYLLKENHYSYYQRIENTIKLIAPYFDKFELKPLALNRDMIKLEWRHVGSDDYFDANHFSDGTLRMICLITLLLQPEMPDTIIIDEPELGLHPAAIELLSSLIKVAAANDKQIICSTQSVTLLNHFQPEDIIVADRNNGESIFNRLDKKDLTDWLNDYSIGELWLKNVLGGRP